MLESLSVDFMSQFHPIEGLDHNHILHYIFYFVCLQPANEMDRKFSLEQGDLFPDFLDTVFSDFQNTEVSEGKNHLSRMGFGDGKDARRRVTPF